MGNGWAESDYSRAFLAITRLGFAHESEKCSVLGTAICDPGLGLSPGTQDALSQFLIEGTLPDQEAFGRALDEHGVKLYKWRQSCWRACYYYRKETFRSDTDRRKLKEGQRPRQRPKWRGEPEDEQAVGEQLSRPARESEAGGSIEAKDAADPVDQRSELHAMLSRERLDRCMDWIAGLPTDLQDVVLVIADRLTIAKYCARHECTASQYQDARRKYIRMLTRYILEELEADGP